MGRIPRVERSHTIGRIPRSDPEEGFTEGTVSPGGKIICSNSNDPDLAELGS